MITKLGKTVSGRVAGSILTSIGLTQFVAPNEEDYVTIALRWASSPHELAALRQGMRERIATSDSGDTVRYCRKVESLYRRFWQDYCAAAPTRDAATRAS